MTNKQKNVLVSRVEYTLEDMFLALASQSQSLLPLSIHLLHPNKESGFRYPL